MRCQAAVSSLLTKILAVFSHLLPGFVYSLVVRLVIIVDILLRLADRGNIWGAASSPFGCNTAEKYEKY